MHTRRERDGKRDWKRERGVGACTNYDILPCAASPIDESTIKPSEQFEVIFFKLKCLMWHSPLKGSRLCLSLPILPLLSIILPKHVSPTANLRNICPLPVHQLTILSSSHFKVACVVISLTLLNCTVLFGISPIGNSGCFLRWQNRASQPTVDAVCFSVSITHPTVLVPPRKILEPEARSRTLRRKTYSFVFATAVISRWATVERPVA